MYDPSTAGQECGLPRDQHDSFMVRLDRDHPARVSIDGRFSSGERFLIERALSTWNAFGRGSSAKRPYFAVSADLSVSVDVPEGGDDCNFDGSDDRFKIVLETDQRRWSALGLTESNPGVTIRCRAGNRLVRQTVFINLSHARSDQLESIALHELGHAIGLDHSCMPGAGRPRYAGCDTLGENHPYRVAAMFPTLRISAMAYGASETKDTLSGNDRERANCIYSIE